MRCIGENWLELFDTECRADDGWRPSRTARSAGGSIITYRTQTIRAGEQIEVRAYPIWNTAPEIPGDPKNRKSPEAMARANETNARLKFARKANTNFTAADTLLTTTYTEGYLPDAEQAKRDMRNYLNRINHACKKAGLPNARYMGVTEGKREGSKQTRLHHHCLISCGLSREELEGLWKMGRVRAERLQPDRYGLTALANYLMKNPQGAKRYFCSRNLKEPVITKADTKLSIRRAERMAADVEEAAPEIFRKLYPDCEFLDCNVKRGKFVEGVYICAKLRKVATEKPKKGGRGDAACGGAKKQERSGGRSRTGTSDGTQPKPKSSKEAGSATSRH